MTDRYRVVLADDHAMFRQGLKKILAEMADVEVVGEAGDGLELLDLLKNVTPDMVILDILMPNLRGIEAIAEMKRRHPGIKVLVLSMYNQIEFLQESFSSGADGYIVKGDAETELFSAIRALRSGKTYVSPLLGGQLINDWRRMDRGHRPSASAALSNREKEVLKLLAEGKSYRKIGDLLFISERTVVRHRTNILDKLNLKKTSDLIKYAVEKGYV
jgi:DNA-binding NarL/FixJ family response regulator